MNRVSLRVAVCLGCFWAVLLSWAVARSAPRSGPGKKFVVTAAQVTDLGTLGGTQSVAADINDGGQVVGWALTAQGIRHAFSFSNGTMSDIGSVFGNADSEAAGINTSGIVAGTLTDQAGAVAFVLNGGFATFLPPGRSGSPHVAAIRDDGTVCGSSGSDAEVWPIVGFPSRLPPPSLFCSPQGQAIAADINASFRVVGTVCGQGECWFCGPGLSNVAVPQPAPSGNYDSHYDALAINDRGEVVGTVILTTGVPVSRAFFWDGVSGTSAEIGVLPTGSSSHGQDINGSRFIAGYGDERFKQPMRPFPATRDRAFLYHSDFGLYELPALPATTALGSCRAFALNSWHFSTKLVQVVGACDVPSDGGTHAVRWDVTVPLIPTLGP